jgi:hypothetical protein
MTVGAQITYAIRCVGSGRDALAATQDRQLAASPKVSPTGLVRTLRGSVAEGSAPTGNNRIELICYRADQNIKY